MLRQVAHVEPVQLETGLITIRSIEERVIGTRNSGVTMQLQPHPKINRIATRLSPLLVPFVTQPCTMRVSSCPLQVIRVASLDYPSSNRTKVDRWTESAIPTSYRPSDYFSGNLSSRGLANGSLLSTLSSVIISLISQNWKDRFQIELRDILIRD